MWTKLGETYTYKPGLRKIYIGLRGVISKDGMNKGPLYFVALVKWMVLIYDRMIEAQQKSLQGSPGEERQGPGNRVQTGSRQIRPRQIKSLKSFSWL